MKILISKDALKRHAQSVPASQGYSQSTMDWRLKLSALLGQWVDVETEHLFADQFNTAELRVFANMVDDIKFEEIGTLENFERLVDERYAVDWPGSIPNTNPVRAILNRAGKGPFEMRPLDRKGDSTPSSQETLQESVLEFTPETYEEFKILYLDARERGADVFEFQGKTLVVDYAKYLIEYFESMLGG